MPPNVADIIDSHVHVVKDNPTYPRNLPAEELIASMDAVGISKAVVVQSKAGNGVMGGYPLEAGTCFANRLLVVAGGEPADPNLLGRFKSLVTDRGSAGIRLFWGGWDPSDNVYDQVWKTGADLGVPILLAGDATYEQLALVCRRFPKTRFLLDHMGRLDFRTNVLKELLVLVGAENVVLKFSATLLTNRTRREAQVLLSKIKAEFGVERLMWGSNFPGSHEPRWTYSGILAETLAVLSQFQEADQEQMLRGTAVSVWPQLGRAKALLI